MATTTHKYKVLASALAGALAAALGALALAPSLPGAAPERSDALYSIAGAADPADIDGYGAVTHVL